MMTSVSVGLGPGSLENLPTQHLDRLCLPGSNHGGTLSTLINFQLGDPYDKENLATFRGGSGGDAIL